MRSCWIILAAERSSGVSSFDSPADMLAIVSGWAARCATSAVPAGVAAPPGTGTNWRFPRSSRALPNAFSILLISKYLQYTQHGNDHGHGDRPADRERKCHDFQAQVFQFSGGPHMGDDRHYRHLVLSRNRTPNADTGIEV